MKVLIILGSIAAILLLLSLVRVGGELRLKGGQFRLLLRLGPMHITVFPLKKRKPKKEAPAAEKPKAPGPQSQPKPRGSVWALVQELLPVAAEAAGRLKRKIRIDFLRLELVVAASDPAAAAVAFGGANAALGMIVPLLENHFNIKEKDLRTGVDFNRREPTVFLEAAFTLTVGQGAALALRTGKQIFGILCRYQQGQKQKEAV